jgi:hypothetical protein
LQEQHNEEWHGDLVLHQIGKDSSFFHIRLEINSSFINTTPSDPEIHNS